VPVGSLYRSRDRSTMSSSPGLEPFPGASVVPRPELGEFSTLRSEVVGLFVLLSGSVGGGIRLVIPCSLSSARAGGTVMGVIGSLRLGEGCSRVVVEDDAVSSLSRGFRRRAF
jgi:hypothetical protein